MLEQNNLLPSYDEGVWFNYDKLKIIRTTFACPEQYYVYYKDKKVSYLRLRSGIFRVDYYGLINNQPETIYEAWAESDGLFSDYERNITLPMAFGLILYKINEEEKEIDQNKPT